MSNNLPYDFLGNESFNAGNLEIDLQYLLNRHKLGVVINVFGAGEDITVGDGTVGIPIPDLLDKTFLTNVLATVDVKGTSGTTDIQIRRVREGTAADILSTKVSIDDSHYFADNGVVDKTNNRHQVLKGDMLYIDVDAVCLGSQGLSIALTFGEKK